MTKNLDSGGLQSIADNYDLFYIDLWGVVHNGEELHDGAIIVLKKLLGLNFEHGSINYKCTYNKRHR